MSVVQEQQEAAATIAVLEVKGDDNENATTAAATTESSSSCRSSMSSFDSNYDHTAPLELGLVINALQAALVEQSEQEEVEEKQEITTDIPEKSELEEEEDEATKKTIKREEKVIVDYEIDQGILNNTGSALKKKSSLSTVAKSAANLIVLNPVGAKTVKVNNLTPREQEKAGNA
jgi:hypothetical protein